MTETPGYREWKGTAFKLTIPAAVGLQAISHGRSVVQWDLSPMFGTVLPSSLSRPGTVGDSGEDVAGTRGKEGPKRESNIFSWKGNFHRPMSSLPTPRRSFQSP